MSDPTDRFGGGDDGADTPIRADGTDTPIRADGTDTPTRDDESGDDGADTPIGANDGAEVAVRPDGGVGTGTADPAGGRERDAGGGAGSGAGAGGTAGRLRRLLVRYRVPLGLVALVVLLRPVLALPFLLGFESVAARILVWILFVAAFNLLFGYGGLLSFGHAMFLGFGVYAVAIGVSGSGPVPEVPFFAAAAVGVGVAALVGNLVGRITVDRGEIYFAFLTLAVAQAVHFLANRDPLGTTGGSNGLSQDVQPAWIDSFRGQLRVVAGPVEFDWYWLVAAVVFLGLLAVWQVARSPFGRALVAVRENERAARAMGIDAYRYKVYALTFSAALSALAGVLLAVNDHGASIENLAVQTSGDVVLMAILGGTNYFFGPVAGTVLWQFLASYLPDFGTLYLPTPGTALVAVDLSGVLAYWTFFLGGAFVVVVVASPRDGLWGYVRRAARRVAVRAGVDVDAWRAATRGPTRPAGGDAGSTPSPEDPRERADGDRAPARAGDSRGGDGE